ncbi:hypothetical protein BV22DRAFT_989198, partial [Leucogyrophana mollusca]
VSDGLSQQFVGRDNIPGNGSEWTVSEDWETSRGIVNDLFHVGMEDNDYQKLKTRYGSESLWMLMIDAILDRDHSMNIREKQHARHGAKGYLIEGGALWRLGSGDTTRARARRECITQNKAITWAREQHMTGGHWGRDTIKIALADKISSPKLDNSIMTAI